MRLPYVPNPPNFTEEEEKAVVERIKERRGERGLIELDRSLLHSPPIADGWNTFLRSIRTRTTLPPTIREAAISRIAVLNRAWYEWQHHALLLQLPAHQTLPALKYIFSAPPFEHPSLQGSAQDGDLSKLAEAAGFQETVFAVLQFTDYSTLRVEVPDVVFERVRKAGFGEREIVELVATVGAYNCVSRFLVALDVNERNGRDGMRESNKLVHEGLIGLEPARRPDGL